MITDLVLLWTVGIRPVLVHGGGPEINSWLTKLGIQPEFKNGLRVTDGVHAGHAAYLPTCAPPLWGVPGDRQRGIVLVRQQVAS